MNLPFLVYGARDGYGWLNGAELPLALRERFRRAAGKLPDFDIGETGSIGVVNAGDQILIYRFMRERNADTHGRNASCLAMTFFPRTMAASVNAEAILLSPLFMAPPASSPPDSIDYADGPPRAAPWHLPGDQAADGEFNRNGSLAAACPVFSDPFPGTLRIMRKNPDDGHGARYSYQPPQSACSAPAPEPTARLQPQPGPVPVDIPAVIINRGCPWPALGLIASLMFFAGYMVGIFLPPNNITKALGAAHATRTEQTPATNAVPSAATSASNTTETNEMLSAVPATPTTATNGLIEQIDGPEGEEQP